MGAYSEASRVRDRYPHDAITAADRAARKAAAQHAPESTCDCVGVEALAAALVVTDGPAEQVTPACQEPSAGSYPEHEKLAAVKDKSQAIGEFLDHVPFQLCKWEPARSEWVPVAWNAVLADYFHINMVALDQEKRAMLDEIREQQP